MKKKKYTVCSLFVGLCLTSMVQAVAPNIVVILADDMGYSDPACFGGEMTTPGIDRLAREGVMMTHFHNGGMCVLSRNCLMTGNYHKAGNVGFATTRLLPETLRDAGYRTGLIGKWHLPGFPMDRGFGRFYGFTDGGGDHFSYGDHFYDNRTKLGATAQPAGYYSADAFTDRAIDFVKAADPKPFFLYLSYQTPHSPLQASPADIRALRTKYASGWDVARANRFSRQKQLGLVPANAIAPDRPVNLPTWNSLSAAQKDLEGIRMAAYRAMVERMDKGIARLTNELAASGKLNNTLILFMSDNGPDSFSSGDLGNLRNDKLPGDPNSNFQPGTGWAYVSATPWRLYKVSQHAGGVTTGAIVRWPAISGKGRIEAEPVHMIDVLPTLLETAGVAKPVNITGESFLPMLKNLAWQRQNPLFFQFADNRAIRSGDWTMAAVDGGRWELFNTKTDVLEDQDLSQNRPDVVNQLNSQWMSWWKSQTGQVTYMPNSTSEAGGYEPQGDRGTGKMYVPSAMPARLANRYPITAP